MKRMSWADIRRALSPRDAALIVGVSAVAGAIVAHAHPAEGALYATLGAACTAIARIDARVFRIPDRLSLPLIPLGGVAACAATGWDGLALRAMVSAGLGAGLWAMAWAFRRRRGKDGLGQGDIKLMVAAALWLPVGALPNYILAAALSALLVVALSRVAGRLADRIPFGSYLAPWLIAMATACRIGLI